MSQYKFINEVNTLLTMDGPVTKGPLARWQRKGTENLNSTGNKSLNASSKAVKTPQKLAEMGNKKTPGKGRTPTPKKGAKTPNDSRFIPARNANNFALAHYKLNQVDDDNDATQQELRKVLCENLNAGDINAERIISYKKKAPSAPEGFQNPQRVIYSQTKTPASVKSSSRYIPQAPDRVLDAPDIVDDYYLNLIDWSDSNILAAALGPHVYLWNEESGAIDQLMELDSNDYVCSVAWIQQGNVLAVGTTQGTTELWDCNQSKRVRIMNGHTARVGSLSWNKHVLASGCRSGQIIEHDVRQRDHNLGVLSGHNQEVCGLRWSPDGKYLASGGNDNVLNIWLNGAIDATTAPFYTFTAHQAAVKALAWCPWQVHVLASGGGTADRHIRFWNCNTGTCINSIDTKSQVCALLWSTNYKELVSGHGYANNELIIWKYPALTKVAELTGHTNRVLHLSMSPDGTTVLSAGADETLRLWKCFTKSKVDKIKDSASVSNKSSVFKQSFR